MLALIHVAKVFLCLEPKKLVIKGFGCTDCARLTVMTPMRFNQDTALCNVATQVTSQSSLFLVHVGFPAIL